MTRGIAEIPSANNREGSKRPIAEKIVIGGCLLMGLAVLIGWLTGNDKVLSVIPNGATMKINTALIFVITAIILLIGRKTDRASKMAHAILAGFILLIGALTLAEYGGFHFIQIDNLIVTDTSTGEYPGRMSPATALCSVLLGIGLLSYRSREKIIRYIGLYALKIVIFISLIAAIAFVLYIPAVSRASFWQTMAIHTSVLFIAIAIIILLKSPDSTFNHMITGKLAGSILFRKLLPFIVLFPVVSCYVLLVAINKNMIAYDFGLVVYAVIFIPLSIIYISFIASGLNKTNLERKQLETDLRISNQDLVQFKHALDQISIVAITDHKGVIKYVNDTFCQISKYSRQELIGNTHAIVNSGYHEKDFFRRMWKTIASGEIWVDEIKNRAKDGTYYWMHTAIMPFKNETGKIVEYLAIRQDITERKEAELLKSKYVEKLEYKNRELEQFAYVTSHDLQEPLRTITSFADLIAKKNRENLDETGKKSLGFILDASSRMSQLIKGLLDYCQLDRDIVLESVDCQELVEDILTDLSKVIEESGAQITFEKLPSIAGYKMQLRLLFQNLISNAIKFRKEDVTPRINISARYNNRYWKFSVRDNGIGIDPAYKEKIFVIFQRLHNKDEYEGTGIGLSNCRKILDLHGGKIWVDSKPNAGSTFYFTIPN